MRITIIGEDGRFLSSARRVGIMLGNKNEASQKLSLNWCNVAILSHRTRGLFIAETANNYA